MIGLPPMESSGYLRPHLGLAYCNRSMTASEVRAAVEPLRLLPLVPLLVDRVQMVEMWRVEGAYTLASRGGGTPAHGRLSTTDTRRPGVWKTVSHTPDGPRRSSERWAR